MNRLKTSIILLFVGIFLQQITAQLLTTDEISKIDNYLTSEVSREISVGKIELDSAKIEGKRLFLFVNDNFSNFPFREENVLKFKTGVKRFLPDNLSLYPVSLITAGRTIDELILTDLSARKNKKRKMSGANVTYPLVSSASSKSIPSKGLQSRHIALWQSHGYYYEQKLTRWEWQRARVFQTVEDLYTQSYVLPFLVPMLENAGANVLIPRERDIQTEEIIVDNDSGIYSVSNYSETNGTKHWAVGNSSGFAHIKEQYIDFENPFKDGTFRQIETIKKGKESVAEWIPNITKSGRYAVYVCYQTLSKSAEDALYTVFHRGGQSVFKINQRMGGGTWIYLGHFNFDKGKASKVVLTNRSTKAGKIVTADAVKFGGGMGNIARTLSQKGATQNIPSSKSDIPTKSQTNTEIKYPYETSGYPRYTEAARYWMQWAGIPDTIYSESRGQNDYTDDYKSRGLWVNYISGGSTVNPEQKGLNIPIDLAFAFHSDAGTTPNDSIIGTLGIYFTNTETGKYPNGISRDIARELTDLIQTSIVDDIRQLYDPNWSRRGMWNRPYSEAKTPVVPTMLLELLSHQNFADMRYGLDPRFRFTVSRAIYKGMLRFIASQNFVEYVVQPLPVDNMRLRFTGNNNVKLSWQAVEDPLEPTAKPDQYIIYQRIGDRDFDNGTLVNSTNFNTTIPLDVVCSYKVTAVNQGGESFPSEILSVGKSSQNKNTVLVINGFDRISAPADFDARNDSLAGFLDNLDHGVPYINDYKYLGRQKEFRRKIPWMDDDASGFGDSYSTHETQVIAGNSFDYPALHGNAILKAGYSFVSCSDESVENQYIHLTNYKIADLILGKEYQTKIGVGNLKSLEFKTFSDDLQKAISDFCLQGGNIFVSGAFVGTDLWDNRHTASIETDQKFASDILKYRWRTGQASISGNVKSVVSPYTMLYDGNFSFYNELNANSYVVESPDAIEPASEGACTILRYSENNLSAGIAYKGDYKTCVLGFPFESLKSDFERVRMMKMVLDFFE
ncbi:MAG: xanthan lyase [Paludibacteraceae bacterium]